MTTKDEAERLATWLEVAPDRADGDLLAAALLRSQAVAIEKLKAERDRNLHSIREGNSIINEKNAEIARKDALLRDALTALGQFSTLEGVGHIGWNGVSAIAAIKTELGEQI